MSQVKIFTEKQTSLPLRTYQTDLIREMRNMDFASNFSTAYLSIPPGGGKTLTAATYVAEHVLNKGHTVLWLAWDWVLLDQAYRTFEQQYKFDPEVIGYAASSKPRGTVFAARDIDNLTTHHCSPKLLFSTPRIWVNQKDALHKAFRPDLIVEDEAHYGLAGVTDRELKKYYSKAKISVLGLSGTPKRRSGWDILEPHIEFKRLVKDRHLAEPVLKSIKTGKNYPIKFIATDDSISRSGKMISQETIKLLSEDHDRNLKIVRYIKDNNLGKTIVFAGNKEHADTLGAMLSSHGSVVIHESVDDPKNLIQEFKNGNYKIAVSVNMLKQGIDIPDVESIIITMPTTSDIAYFQMACRGARPAPGKSTFNLIDVADTFNNLNHNEVLVNSARFFKGGGRRSDEDVTRSTLLSTKFGERVRFHNRTLGIHQYESNKTFTLRYNESAPIFLQRLDGFRILKDQTFGVECELAPKNPEFDIGDRKKWEPIAASLLNSIKLQVGPNLVSKAPLFSESEKRSIDYSKWNVVYDGSCGFEIVSPILIGREGFEDLVTLFHSLEADNVFNKNHLEVNTSTGLHVHLGWKYKTIEQTKRLLHLIRRFSPALYSIVAPSRLGNHHCRPIKQFMSLSSLKDMQNLTDFKDTWRDHDTRYHDINFRGVNKREQTFEVRMHSGTTEAFKMALWISFWMNVAHAVDRPGNPLEIDSENTGRAIEFTTSEESDLLQLAKLLGLDVNHNWGFFENIHNRRMEIFGNKHWRKKLGDQAVSKLLKYWERQFEELRPR